MTASGKASCCDEVQDYVIKTNHGSGQNIVVEGDNCR
jgi:hypothetical protein